MLGTQLFEPHISAVEDELVQHLKERNGIELAERDSGKADSDELVEHPSEGVTVDTHELLQHYNDTIGVNNGFSWR